MFVSESDGGSGVSFALFFQENRLTLGDEMIAAIIDWDQAGELYQGDGEEETAFFQREIWNEFKKSLFEDLRTLPKVIDSGGDGWEKATHSIQGYSYSAGASGLGNIFREAQQGDKGPAWLKERLPLLEQLAYETVAEIERVFPHLLEG